MKRTVWVSILCMSLLAWSQTANAQSGASDDRVSLPEGPGSLEGVGENVDVDPNMGMMRYNVAIDVPEGFNATTPGLSLSYGSGGGGGVVGMGWSMDMPSIERMTYRKLPTYDLNDDFAANGSEQLVKVSEEPLIYRARFEGGFMRYTWINAGSGDEGYWICESSDGAKSYYGADANGNLVDSARVSGDEGTFRYMLVEKVDVHGHKIRYTYQKDGHISLVNHIGYVFPNGENDPQYEVEFSYEERRDATGVDYLSDAKAGFNELLTQRLTDVRVKTRGATTHRYALSYEPYASSGGFTRLTKVEKFGLDDSLFPVVFSFEYSQALAGVCDGNNCEQPFMVDMGQLGVTPSSGRATLLDINGDALPDLLDTTENGPHRFFLNIANVDGTSTFDTTPVLSEVGTRSSHDLAAATTQVLDTNGDGFTDLVDAVTGQILLNKGNGDWEMNADMEGTSSIADALAEDFNADEGGLQSLKFLDYNNDKRIDLVRSTLESTTIYQNMGDDGFSVDNGAETIGVDFSEDGAQFADMNGDGLLDIVRVRPGLLLYRLNHGWGKWGEQVEILNLSISEAEVERAELEDMNGDGLADLVVVNANAVKYALNRNTTEFTEAIEIIDTNIQGDLPFRSDEVVVLFADMNGNGSSDVVWIDPNGRVQYLELFPVRPNLMSKVSNGIGQIAEISYSTSAVFMARDGGWDSWRYKLPFPNLLVDKIDQYDLWTNVHEEQVFTYHNGYYDGFEKQFRGFENVEIVGVGNAYQEEGEVRMTYDVGATDVYRKNLLLMQSASSDGRPLNKTENSYGDCDVDGISIDTELPIRFVCPTRTLTTHQEGKPESEWITTETYSEYDGYGNITLSADLGVVNIGGGSCEPCGNRSEEDFGVPCGSQCLGDESYTENEYVSLSNTNNRWYHGAPFRMKTYGRPGSDLYTETLTYYDGPDFEGLPLGNLDKGLVTRVTEKLYSDQDRVIETVRKKFDEHGNSVETLDPLGEADGNTHKTSLTYSADGLRVIAKESHLQDEEGNPYQLRLTYSYETLFDRLIQASSWLMVEGGQVVSVPRSSDFEYDEFGRVVARVLNGEDTLEMPSEAFIYELQSPVSRVIAKRRSVPGGPMDMESVRCFDGRGRVVQERVMTAPGEYIVNGFTTYNVQSKPLRQYQSYLSNSDECDLEPPEDTRYLEYRYDAAYRPLTITMPDEDLFGTASVLRTEYAPLRSTTYDPESNDPNSPHYNTPKSTETNGLGQIVRSLSVLNSGEEGKEREFHFDELGRIVAYTDEEGNQKSQTYDLLGRVTEIIDPNSGDTVTNEYDDASNLIRTMDDRGMVTVQSFDGLNRMTAKWNEDDRDASLIQQHYDKPVNCDASLCTFTPWRLSAQSYPGPNGERAHDRFGYDHRGRPVYISREINGTEFELHTEYDNADRIVAVTYPNGELIEQIYDSASRPSSVPGFVQNIQYNAQGQMTQYAYNNGIQTQTSYDGVLRPSTMNTVLGDQVLQGFSYTRDRIGHIQSITDNTTVDTGIPSFEGSFTYDGWYRLTTAELSEETLDYDYNDINNLLSRTSSLGDASPAHIGTYTYDNNRPNAVTGAGNLDIEYDLSGNVSQRGNQSMTWDYMNRLTTVESPGHLTQLSYDIGMRRLSRDTDGSISLYLTNDFIVRDGISELYITMGGTPIARIESDSLATTVLPDLSLTGQTPDGELNAGDAWLAHARQEELASVNEARESSVATHLWSSVRRLLLETGPEDGITYLHTDHLGSFTMATDKNGEVIGRRIFYPFGQERASEGYVDPMGYTGREEDPYTGLIEFENRYYDPALGRWTAIDPGFAEITVEGASDEGTLAYAYSSNDPINKYDLGGLETVALFINMEDSQLNDQSPNFDKYTFDAHQHFNSQNNVSVKKSTANSSNRLKWKSLRGSDGVLHLVGHSGNHGGGGLFGQNKRALTPSGLVDRLVTEGLKPGDRKGMTINLHGCTTGVKTADNDASFAQYFAEALSNKGFYNVKVVGYNGFIADGNQSYPKWVIMSHKADTAPSPGGASGKSVHVSKSKTTFTVGKNETVVNGQDSNIVDSNYSQGDWTFNTSKVKNNGTFKNKKLPKTKAQLKASKAKKK